MRAEAQAYINRIEAALALVRQSLDWERALRRLDELNARVPLSIARWHRHVNYCFPTERRRMAETRDGKPLFGPVGILSTRAECEAAGGEFTPQLFGWMVHANVFAGTDPKSVWGADHGHDHPPH